MIYTDGFTASLADARRRDAMVGGGYNWMDVDVDDDECSDFCNDNLST